MPYFLSDKNLELNKQTELAGPEARHILLAKRARVGETIILQGPDGNRFICEIVTAKKNNLVIISRHQVPVPQEPSVQIILFQAFVAEQALDAILQKATELRATKIILFNSERVATRLTKERWASKQERWNKILWEAAKQSERAKPPELEFVLNLAHVLESLEALNKVVLLDPEAKENFKSVTPELSSAKQLGIVIGPEGGLTAEENQQFKSLPNAISVNMGPILLRADTAAIASLAILQSIF